MTDKHHLLEQFVHHFVVKALRERSLAELNSPKKRAQFINRLNHNWDTVLDRRKVHHVSKDQDNRDQIRRLAGFADNELCYVISHYDDCDDQFLPFGEMLKLNYGRGLATLLIHTSGDRFFLETEQSYGSPSRFTGVVE